MLTTRQRFTRRDLLLAASVGSVACRRQPDAEFRPLCDGKTLKGWRALPRVPTSAYPGAPAPSRDSAEYQRTLTSHGRWVVDNGAIIACQEPVGSGLGGYLVCEETFGDFELLVDVNPDWAVDSGIMIRTTDLGGQGYQVHLDYRLMGSVGTFFGNGIGMWRARHYAFNPKMDANRQVVGLIPELAPDEEIRRLAWHSAPEDFFNTWRFGDWNTMRIRCEGLYPHITSWVNGVKLAELDAATLQAPHYDREAAARLLGHRGHIAFEVHNTSPEMMFGADRWLPGHVCRFRNIRIKTLR